jgi:hypothetical protein
MIARGELLRSKCDGGPAITKKSTFTKEEKDRLLSSPMVAGMAITAADPSGVWGLPKEGLAGAGRSSKHGRTLRRIHL